MIYLMNFKLYLTNEQNEQMVFIFFNSINTLSLMNKALAEQYSNIFLFSAAISEQYIQSDLSQSTMSFILKGSQDMIPVDVVTKYIKEGFSRAQCENIHPLSCNRFCATYVITTWGNTYKTYGAVYLVQLLFKLKTISKNPIKELPKFIIAYIKSTSLTAVQMMLMRRILCFACRFYANKQNNLILANFLSAFYLLIESKTRRAEIALYQLNNTMNIIYLMAKRRGYVKGLAYGECLLFALAMMVISFHYYDCKDAFRRSYILTLFEHLTGQKY